MGNNYQTFLDTITQTGITDFSNYTFLMSEGFGDTTVVIDWCGTTTINEFGHDRSIVLFPNPVVDWLHVIGYPLSGIAAIEIFDVLGNLVLRQQQKTAYRNLTLNVSDLVPGIYFLRTSSEGTISSAPFVKM